MEPRPVASEKPRRILKRVVLFSTISLGVMLLILFVGMIFSSRRAAVAQIAAVGNIIVDDSYLGFEKSATQLLGHEACQNWVLFSLPVRSVTLMRSDRCNDIADFRVLVESLKEVGELRELTIYWEDQVPHDSVSDYWLKETIGDSLDCLKYLPNLEKLSIHGAIDDSAMREIAKAKGLRELQINSAPITGSAFSAEWMSRQSLRDLDLSYTECRSESLKGLNQFESLESVVLDNCDDCDEASIQALLSKGSASALIFADN